MRRVGRSVVTKNNQLLILAALNDLGRTSSEFCLDLIYDRQYEWRKQAENKNIDLVYLVSVSHTLHFSGIDLTLKLFNEIRKNWNLLDGLRD